MAVHIVHLELWSWKLEVHNMPIVLGAIVFRWIDRRTTESVNSLQHGCRPISAYKSGTNGRSRILVACDSLICAFSLRQAVPHLSLIHTLSISSIICFICETFSLPLCSTIIVAGPAHVVSYDLYVKHAKWIGIQCFEKLRNVQTNLRPNFAWTGPDAAGVIRRMNAGRTKRPFKIGLCLEYAKMLSGYFY